MAASTSPWRRRQPLRLALLEQGFVYASRIYAAAGNTGETWHDAGTKLKKQNVFDDFIAAADWLMPTNILRGKKLASMAGRTAACW